MRKPYDGAAAVVANPGGARWMRAIARALAEAGVLRAYITPVVIGSRTEAGLRRVPGKIGCRLRDDFTRRSSPEGVPPELVERTSTARELVHVATTRAIASPRFRDRLVLWRGRGFDRQVARRLRPDDGAVIAAPVASPATFTRAHALGIAALLDFPIAHHRFAEPILREEAELAPAYARTLQFVDLPGSMSKRMDQAIALADRIFVLSSFQARTFAASGVSPERLFVNPPGVDLELFRPHPRRENDTFRVIFGGQITQRKGISYLIEGFCRARIPRSELVLLGRTVGTSAPWASKTGVRHVPHGPRRELPLHYSRSDVFVLPSIVEGFGQMALEAMACAIPVIVSENTFAHDVITDGVDGFVVPIRSADAITERLRYLYANPGTREAMGRAARRRSEEFTWGRYGARAVAAVREALRQ